MRGRDAPDSDPGKAALEDLENAGRPPLRYPGMTFSTGHSGGTGSSGESSAHMPPMDSGHLRGSEGYAPLERGANLASLSILETSDEMSNDYHERGITLGSPGGTDLPGDRHDQAGLQNLSKTPTLADHFGSAAGAGHDGIVELAGGNPADARMDAASAAIDPVSLPLTPLAPEALTPANPFHLASFLRNFLYI